MAFEITAWLSGISSKIQLTFADRVLFIGYHGSYCRHEATESSDVDMVVILDKVTLNDLKEYQAIVASMPYSEKACGFIAGREELEAWPKADMFQLVFETKSIFGNLQNLFTPLSKEDVAMAVKIGSGNIYHAACHSFLYDKDLKSSLTVLYKMAFFVLQAKYYQQSGQYIPTQKELLLLLDGKDREILEYCINRKSFMQYEATEINSLYEKLILWSADSLKEK
uniref:Polymerase nucleotidyl transferase domain-containing protein n=1 Tax=uncultured Alphaproteobacteria bacterium TaxID=91750 RepID=A0A6G8F2P0_9PROT|nr:hypothetical protein PlAlph_4190 [uncultured Alphaproteobacteria bacterium]